MIEFPWALVVCWQQLSPFRGTVWRVVGEGKGLLWEEPQPFTSLLILLAQNLATQFLDRLTPQNHRFPPNIVFILSP